MSEQNLLDYWKAEYNGIIQEHMNLWRIYTNAIRIYLVILALPFPIVSIFLQSIQWTFPQPLPLEIRAIVLVIGLIGFLFLQVIIRYRLDVIMYARWLNGLRKGLEAKYPEIGELMKTATLPQDPKIPSYFELSWHTGFFLFISGILNTGYLFIGIFKILALNRATIIFVLVSFTVHILAYLWQIHQPRILGEKLPHDNGQ